ncbi:MAG: cyclic pyranopterin monophosphate synthase MoaC [Candidatus Hatepunaea meridiana]|nr:cyclic pyranopterin monophosphate synthase MoaC [Candidatus Hatepunaea meridiana]
MDLINIKVNQTDNLVFMNELSHIDRKGQLRMVDVGDKPITARRAVAEGIVITGSDIIETIRSDQTPKGNVLEAARLAGINGAKHTWELIPLCHQLPLDHVQIDFELEEDRIRIITSASTRASTGVEMEALTGTTIAALTIYDMLKAVSHSITIESIRLLSKSGGKSGDYHAANIIEKDEGTRA